MFQFLNNEYSNSRDSIVSKNEETYLGHITEVNYGTGSYERAVLSSMSN